MNAQIKVGDKTIDADSFPIQIFFDGIYSQEVIDFYVNGIKYILTISKGGKLVLNK